MENEEVICRRMEQTREALNEKLETLEQKVAKSVNAVTDTVASVQEKVHEGVETVKDAVNVQAQVDRHPWLALGGSVLCGLVLGNLLMGQREKRPEPPRMPPRAPENTNGNGHQQAAKQSASSPVESLLAGFEPEIRHLKGLALGVTLGTVREMLTEQVPPHMADQLRDIIDAVTKKAGGEPIPSSDWAAAKSASPPEAECKLNV